MTAKAVAAGAVVGGWAWATVVTPPSLTSVQSLLVPGVVITTCAIRVYWGARRGDREHRLSRVVVAVILLGLGIGYLAQSFMGGYDQAEDWFQWQRRSSLVALSMALWWVTVTGEKAGRMHRERREKQVEEVVCEVERRVTQRFDDDVE